MIFVNHGSEFLGVVHPGPKLLDNREKYMELIWIIVVTLNGKAMAAASWTPHLGSRDGPIYLSIADALAEDIATGRLAEGVQLPTQRKLADDLGIDFTTVSRAYSEARSRGLIEGKVGQGTYVRSKRGARPMLLH